MMYFLNEDKTYREADVFEWGQQFEKMDRHVAEDMINGFRVSTVWLGLDHNYFGGPPLVLETMVFDESGQDVYMNRYTTWAEAEEGHKEAVQWVKDDIWRNPEKYAGALLLEDKSCRE